MFIISALAGAALAGEWKSYVNERFSARADVPADYKADEKPANDDGLSFTSPEGDAQILIWGAFATVNEESFADYAKRLVSYDRDDGWNVSYSAGRDDWFAFRAARLTVFSTRRLFRLATVRSPITCGSNIPPHARESSILSSPTRRNRCARRRATSVDIATSSRRKPGPIQ